MTRRIFYAPEIRKLSDLRGGRLRVSPVPSRSLGAYFRKRESLILAVPPSKISDCFIILLLGNEANKMTNMLSKPKKTLEFHSVLLGLLSLF